MLNYAWRDYGNRIGIWRLLDLFGALSLPATVLLNSSIYDYCPEIAAARDDIYLCQAGDIAAHAVTQRPTA